MARARIGGNGQAFNVGEVTLSRAVLSNDSGCYGFGQVLGVDKRRAWLCAAIDLVSQEQPSQSLVDEQLAAVKLRIDKERYKTAAQTAATKVDFFTLVRGEDT